MKAKSINRAGKKPCSWNSGCYAINFLLFAASVFYFFQGARKLDEAKILMNSKSIRKHIPLNELLVGDNSEAGDDKGSSDTKNKITANSSEKTDANVISKEADEEYQGFGESVGTETCTDPIWCNVKMPSKSYFKFDPPKDENRWKKAQILAASGDQLLLKRILQHFPHPLDFLDGDRSFRRIHALVDVFVDKTIGLDDLKKTRRANTNNLGVFEGKRVVPLAYNFRDFNRAPLLTIGYTVFERDFNEYFSGNRLGYSGIDRGDFLNRWRIIRHEIDTPFMAMCQGNENWGWLSTMFPNRTAKWGACCNKPADLVLYDFLDDKNTLMLIINQHFNVSHPKILNIPRGLPLTWEHTERLVWDAMRISAESKKEVLLFAAASNWGPRPQILKCISAKMDPKDFSGHADVPPAVDKEEMKTNRVLYYRKLASTRFGLALPGLGYDCFRTWELMTMGTIVVIERGIGMDRTLWRLPALLVDDFADVEPSMLREAYVEAMYRIDDFEFERLTMSFWWSVISNVSVSKSTVPMLEKFPMEAEDADFTRPREPYACGLTNTCGKGTKRIPKNSC